MTTRLARPPRDTHRALQVAAACLLTLLCIAPALGTAGLTSVDEFSAGKARAEAGKI